MAEPVVYVLIHPITRSVRVAGGSAVEEEITEVSLRRLNGGDIRWTEAQASKPALELGLLGRLTGLEPNIVDKLDAEDIAGMAEVMQDFLPQSLRTGRTSQGS